ncbi:hypothetical protein Tco_0584299 [Tanacetum coccineum]
MIFRSSYEISPSVTPPDLPSRKRYRSTSELVEDGEEDEEVVPGGQQHATLVVGTVVSVPLGLGYGALRHRELALEEDDVYAQPVQTPPSPEWMSGSLPISPSPSVVPSPVSSPMVPLTAPSPVASPTTTETEGFLTELGAQVEMQGGLIRDHAGENRDLRLQLVEERRARLELAEVVDSMGRRQEPRGGDIIGGNRPWMVTGSIGKSCDDQLET